MDIFIIEKKEILLILKLINTNLKNNVLKKKYLLLTKHIVSHKYIHTVS